jgi:hypothetical protein
MDTDTTNPARMELRLAQIVVRLKRLAVRIRLGSALFRNRNDRQVGWRPPNCATNC